jgi:lambda repressor-like predicted transcriptional regulator
MFSTNRMSVTNILSHRISEASTDMAKFNQVKDAMKAANITYKDLSRLTGFSVSRLCNAVNGRPASEKVKRSIALALGVAYESLWVEQQ